MNDSGDEHAPLYEREDVAARLDRLSGEIGFSMARGDTTLGECIVVSVRNLRETRNALAEAALEIRRLRAGLRAIGNTDSEPYSSRFARDVLGAP